MAVVFCSCDEKGANTGAPGSQDQISTAEKLIFVHRKADDGTVNHIANTDTLDQAYIDARLNDVDKSKRWYPVPVFTNPNDDREDPNYQEFDDGTRGITRLGRRTWSGILLDHSSRYLSKMESWACQDFSVYEIDHCGNLTGNISDGTKLFPNRVNASSFAAILKKGTQSELGGIKTSFDFKKTLKDKNLRMIKGSAIVPNLLEIDGLQDVTVAISNITTTGFRAALTLPFDGFGITDPAAISWGLADFNLYNTTTTSSISITSVTETDPGVSGVYDFVMPAQTSADVLRLRSSKNGFDMGDVSITIP